ncbi:follistatin-related protein 1-like isoform X1 [Nerophis ophidion]|uniref:follistatin-related protein 1-like isoform X1 n=1 Tax=Nerophis ophidion TaxID=159077 RepID=UPI002AE08453|nr:follistatin-related protein 1-like isoform X1 [Nerophis ophidion]XP_061767378.1 follistatin-related protein 1-like isoform X1 [Nerophis ophidion]
MVITGGVGQPLKTMLPISALLLLLLLPHHPVSVSPVAKDQSVCSRTFCGAGRECVSDDGGRPVCRCLQRCDVSEHWVCASNGRSYRNHCELHRDACITRTKIHAETRGRCPEKPAKTDVSPIVCFLSDRDWLRERVIQWVQQEVGSDASSVNELMQTYFQMYDNGDSQLDSKEFLSFLQHNETALNLNYSNTLETNTLLRSLCVDALIELSDENADWKLSPTEFINCLTPTYHPPERNCALEDEVFEDGAETRMECNKCVCACGNWVCTALTCNGEPRVDVKDEEEEEEEEEEMTEEEWSKRVAELSASQESLATQS